LDLSNVPKVWYFLLSFYELMLIINL
jgi:hypothetical protein